MALVVELPPRCSARSRCGAIRRAPTSKRYEPPPGSDEDVARKDAIVGALALYLDFVNLFLYLLRIFGRRK